MSTLHKISKKYNQRQSLKTWESPPQEIIDSIQLILSINKQSTLSRLPKNSKNLNKVNKELSNFIIDFVDKLSNDNQPLIFPKFLDDKDYDYDYQLSKNSFLNNLLSNELNLVKELKLNLKDSKLELKDLIKFVTNYEKLYNVELNKLDSDDLIQLEKSEKTDNTLQLDDLIQDDEEEEEDLDELELKLNSTIDEMDAHLNKLSQHTHFLDEISTKLDELNDKLQ